MRPDDHTDDHSHTGDALDFGIGDLLRYALAVGVVLVLLLPGARGFSETLGWLPLWLLAMPAAALWALHGFRLPRRGQDGEEIRLASVRRRRTGAQAKRRPRPASRRATTRAA